MGVRKSSRLSRLNRRLRSELSLGRGAICARRDVSTASRRPGPTIWRSATRLPMALSLRRRAKRCPRAHTTRATWTCSPPGCAGLPRRSRLSTTAVRASRPRPSSPVGVLGGSRWRGSTTTTRGAVQSRARLLTSSARSGQPDHAHALDQRPGRHPGRVPGQPQLRPDPRHARHRLRPDLDSSPAPRRRAEGNDRRHRNVEPQFQQPQAAGPLYRSLNATIAKVASSAKARFANTFPAFTRAGA
jgi:hypothetical protein